MFLSGRKRSTKLFYDDYAEAVLWKIALLIFLNKKSWVTPLSDEETSLALNSLLAPRKIVDDNPVLSKHIESIREALPGKVVGNGVTLYGCGPSLASQFTQVKLSTIAQNIGCEIQATFFSVPLLVIFVLITGIIFASSLITPLVWILGGPLLFCLYLAFHYFHRINISRIGKLLSSELKATS